MSSTFDKFLTGLVGAKDWNPQFAQMREWALAGQIEHLIDIAAALTDQAKLPGIDMWVQQSIFEKMVRTLASTPGFCQAEAGLLVMMMPQPTAWPPRRWKTTERWHANVAECLAQWQPPDVLLSLFEGHGSEACYREILACLVQEMALRGYAVIGAAADFWHKRIVGTQHPLGWLPITLLDQEKMFPKYLPHRRLGSSHISWADPGLEDDVVEPQSPIEMNVLWIEAEVSQREKAALEAAVFDWTQDSNGKIEPHLFCSATPVPAEAITPTMVLALPLECLAGTTVAGLRFGLYPASRALALLFCAAASGGAYTIGYDGAYGRLAAWRSAGALVGADADADIYQTAQFVSDCAWFSARSNSGWFYDVAWDIGLLALRPDGRTLATLAATDTD